MKGIIIAGGEGTRLRPLTYQIPKPVIPVVNKPLLQHQIELLKKFHIKEIILCLHYLSEKIKEELGDGRKFGVKLFYSLEKKPLGTGGAVKNAKKFFGNDNLVVLNGDIITEIDLFKVINFYFCKRASLVLVLTPVEDPTHYGLVITDKNLRVKKFLEKPSWEQVKSNNINAGIYVMNSGILDYWENTGEFSFERELFPFLLEKKVPCYGFINKNYWLDLGKPANYLQAHFEILLGKVSFKPSGKEVIKGIWLENNVKFSKKSFSPLSLVCVGKKSIISKGAVLGELVSVGREVFIGSDSFLEKSVILHRVKLGNRVVIKNSIIGPDAVIEDDVVIEETILAGGSVIKKGSKIRTNFYEKI